MNLNRFNNSELLNKLINVKFKKRSKFNLFYYNVSWSKYSKLAIALTYSLENFKHIIS